MKKNAQLEMLKESFKKGTHAHAYLFHGGRDEERKKAAHELAELITGHSLEKLNPDVLAVGPKEGEEHISIQAVREIQRFLSFEPYFGEGKAVIVDGMERMEEAASSALLKALEEPPERSVLMLLAQGTGAMLPTILSRVRKIRFPGVPAEAIDKRKEMFYTLSIIVSAHIADRFVAVEKICKDEGEAESALDYWISFIRDASYLAMGGREELLENAFLAQEIKEMLSHKAYTLSDLGKILSEIVRIRSLLSLTNINCRLALEHVVLLF